MAARCCMKPPASGIPAAKTWTRAACFTVSPRYRRRRRRRIFIVLYCRRQPCLRQGRDDGKGATGAGRRARRPRLSARGGVRPNGIMSRSKNHTLWICFQRRARRGGDGLVRIGCSHAAIRPALRNRHRNCRSDLLPIGHPRPGVRNHRDCRGIMAARFQAGVAAWRGPVRRGSGKGIATGNRFHKLPHFKSCHSKGCRVECKSLQMNEFDTRLNV